METSNNTTIIKTRAIENDYIGDGFVKLGYKVINPYYEINFLFRIIREIWFKLDFPGKKIWYNKKILFDNTENIIVYDPLITEDYLMWLKNSICNRKIIFQYNNLIEGKAEHIQPIKVKKYADEVRSYDWNDCKKYKMKYSVAKFNPVYRFNDNDKGKIIYDIVFLGRDKGRGECLLKLKKAFEDIGLRVFFRICADRLFQIQRKSYYGPVMSYLEYVELLKHTKAHLNIVYKHQVGITQRDLETVFNNIKCITNNTHIKQFELYHPSRFFIIGVDDFSSLKDFLELPFEPIDEKRLMRYMLQ